MFRGILNAKRNKCHMTKHLIFTVTLHLSVYFTPKKKLCVYHVPLFSYKHSNTTGFQRKRPFSELLLRYRPRYTTISYWLLYTIVVIEQQFWAKAMITATQNFRTSWTTSICTKKNRIRQNTALAIMDFFISIRQNTALAITGLKNIPFSVEFSWRFVFVSFSFLSQ